MGVDDRIENQAENVTGRGKEAVGAAFGNDSLKAEGQADQTKAKAKDKVEDVKDKVKEKVDDIL